MSALSAACAQNRVDAARTLLDRGADVDERSGPTDTTPLYEACKAGHIDAATLCLDRGARVEREIRIGLTPLYVACSRGHVEAATLLLDRGADANNAGSRCFLTPLYFSCCGGHVDVGDVTFGSRRRGRPGAELRDAILRRVRVRPQGRGAAMP